MAPLPVHWNRPPQSPVWQCPDPEPSNEQPVRPQIRPPQLSGTEIVALCPGASTHPVAASGCFASAVAATQTVWLSALTTVKTRCPAAATAGAVVGFADGEGL